MKQCTILLSAIERALRKPFYKLSNLYITITKLRHPQKDLKSDPSE